MSNSWWDAHLPVVQRAEPARIPGKAVSWQPAPVPAQVETQQHTESPEGLTVTVPTKATGTLKDGKGLCPNCGGNNFSTRTAGILRGPPPSPRCFECGFNGLYDLSGGDPTGSRSDAIETRQTGGLKESNVDFSRVQHMQGFTGILR